MKTKQTALILVFLAAGMLLVSGCKDKDEDEVPSVLNPTTKDVSFGKITVSSSDQRTPSEWNTVLGNLVSALNAAYNGAPPPAKSQFESVFGGDDAKIVLVDNLANNWEVRDGEFKTLYLKIGSIATANYLGAVQVMSIAMAPGVGKTTPTKDSVFLAVYSA